MNFYFHGLTPAASWQLHGGPKAQAASRGLYATATARASCSDTLSQAFFFFQAYLSVSPSLSVQDKVSPSGESQSLDHITATSQRHNYVTQTTTNLAIANRSRVNSNAHKVATVHLHGRVSHERANIYDTCHGGHCHKHKFHADSFFDGVVFYGEETFVTPFRKQLQAQISYGIVCHWETVFHWAKNLSHPCNGCSRYARWLGYVSYSEESIKVKQFGYNSAAWRIP